MNHSALKRFAQETRRKLITQISTRLDYVFHQDDPYIRAHGKEKKKIESLIAQKGEVQFLEETAYIWFNRLTALRFMDNKGYNRVGIVSPAEGESQPRILAEIKQGRLPQEIKQSAGEIMDYINGTIAVADPDREAYKTALLAWCNYRGKAMPYLFTQIEDWAALLLPQDLLSEVSIITDIQNNILPEDCKDVEIIGWLYQYYISEKKDEVFADLKKNKKITAENIPAATQLFTPEWIVRYMVENSLGRLWLNNHPGSGLREKMKYYVEADKDKEFLQISDPEEIKMIDPSCGSGHILVYAFDLLYRIYEEEGYSPLEIAPLIIQNNLYGVDIDDRAAALASFALAMKASEIDRTFLEKEILPHVIASQNVEIDVSTLSVSKDLAQSLEFLKEAKNLGSLIPVSQASISEIENHKTLEHRSNDMFQTETHNDLQTALTQLEYLSPRYHCVVTNPPYMGSKGMNGDLGNFVKKYYPDSKADLFAVFMEKGLELSIPKGYIGMINQQSWMFLSSFEKLRSKLISNYTILSMAHLGPRAFDSIGGEVVQTTSFVIKNGHEDIKGVFNRLIEGKSEAAKEALFSDKNLQFTAKASDFSKIPGCPIAYWVSESVKNCFYKFQSLNNKLITREGLTTGDNHLFLRLWYEVNFRTINITINPNKNNKWFPYVKGGSFRRWYGNLEYIVNWENDGLAQKNNIDIKTGRIRSHNYNGEYALKKGLTWSGISSGDFAVRYTPEGFMFDAKGPMGFALNNKDISFIMCFLNTKITSYILKFLAPTLDFKLGHILNLPVDDDFCFETYSISINKSDWDLRENSWDFLRSPLLIDYSQEPIETVIDENLTDISWPTSFGLTKSLSDSFQSFKSFWTDQFKTLHQNEEELNRIFIDHYELQDELTPEVPYDEITILQNELDTKAIKKGKLVFKKDEIFKQFISYGVGCIFGRYSLDKDGLILANAGEGLDDYLRLIPEPSFKPDASGILPITDENDFADDLPNQFETFLKASFGVELYSENLQFVEEALGKDIRSYFTKEFYKDHVQRYKTRPIYWMISSPSGSFRALIYLHRYTRDTISLFLNDYLRPYQKKLHAKQGLMEQTLISGSTSGNEKAQAQKKIDQIRKVLMELEEWERDVVYPLATQRVVLDLDDGVKVNYGKLGNVLEKVKGLNG